MYDISCLSWTPSQIVSGKTCRLKFTIFQLLCTENLSLPQSCVSAMICYCWQAVNLGAPSAKRKEAFQLGQLHLQQAARWCFHCSPVCYYSKMQPVCKAFSLIWISFFFFYYPQHLPTFSLFCVTLTTNAEYRGCWVGCACSNVE